MYTSLHFPRNVLLLLREKKRRVVGISGGLSSGTAKALRIGALREQGPGLDSGER